MDRDRVDLSSALAIMHDSTTEFESILISLSKNKMYKELNKIKLRAYQTRH